MQAELYPLIRTEIARIQKAEWLAAYAVVREKAFLSFNIKSAWSGARLALFDRLQVLSRIPQPSPPPSPRSFTPDPAVLFDMPSSPLDITVVRNANTEMRRQLSSNLTIEIPVRRHIDRLVKSHEKLWARTTVLESQNKDLKKVVSKRKEQANGVRAIIKGKHLLMVGEVYDKVESTNRATKQCRKSTANPAIDPSLINLAPHSMAEEIVVMQNMPTGNK